MNLLNRILVIFFSAIAIPILGGLILTALFMPRQGMRALRDFTFGLDAQVNLFTQVAASGAAAVLIVAAVLLLIAQFPRRRTKDFVRIQGVSGGSGVLALDAIVQRVQHEAKQIEGVLGVRPAVKSRGKAVDIDVQVLTNPMAEAGTMTEEVCQTIRENVEGKMGVKVRKIRVRVEHEPIAPSVPGKGQ